MNIESNNPLQTQTLNHYSLWNLIQALLLAVLLLCIFAIPAHAQLNHQWAWMSGSDVIGQSGSYGTKGTPSASNLPGARYRAISWRGPNGDLWLMGGFGYDADGDRGNLNDLWRYDRSSGQWTWVSGSNAVDQSGSYGTKGTPSASNVPGGRYAAISWRGPNGDLWLMGGLAYDSNGIDGRLNDLWCYDPSMGQWTWVSGDSTRNQAGSYGTKGVASVSNAPGGRSSAVSWTGPDGDLWLMGGFGYDANGDQGELNDLWRYDLSSGAWTWVSGSDTRDQSGSYGTQGTPSASNVPGARRNAISWTGPDGDLWLMGGHGYDSAGDVGRLNDLWRYDISSGQWTWVSGSDTQNQPGSYGTKGVASVSNAPGGRSSAVSWRGPDGDLWLMGGFGYDANSDRDNLNDLWRYDISSGQWTWVSGSDTQNQPGSYGTKGVASVSNAPGGRSSAVSWTGPDGDLWLMGGHGYDSAGVLERLNDLWRLTGTPGALTLDGSNGYGRVPDADALDVSDSFTLETWVKFDDVDRSEIGGSWMALMMKGDFSSSYGLMLNTGSDDKTLAFFHNGAGDDSTTVNWTQINTGTWYHVAAVKDGSDTWLYIDGILESSELATGSVNTTADSLFIGKNGGTFPMRLDGKLTGVRVWNKALSQQEIRDNMNMPMSGLEPGLAGAWLPRTGGRHSAVDQTGSGNDMTNISGSYTADFPPVKVSIGGAEGWRFLAAPGDTTEYGELLQPLWTQGYTGADDNSGSSNVYYYDEVNRTWQAPASAKNVVGTASDLGDGTGKGALVYVYADDDNDGSDDPFPKTLTLDAFGKTPPVQIPLSYTDTGVSGNDGWHLVSNPYPVAIYWQEIVSDGANNNALDYAYIWDHSLNNGSGGYRVHYGEPSPPSLPGNESFDGRIPAFQSFWVKAEGQNANLQLTADHHVPNTDLYKQPVQQSPYLKLQMNGQQFNDAISLIFPSDEQSARDDVPKLNSLSAEYANLFITDSNGQRWMAKHLIPGEENEEFVIPVDVDATVEGTYELSWNLESLPNDWAIELEEVATGNRIDLRSAAPHQFTVSSDSSASKKVNAKRPPLPVPPGSKKAKGDTEPRFRLHISTQLAPEQQIPTEVTLNQNYPNPFNPETVIEYGVPEETSVSLQVYDMLGRNVATLVDGQKPAGSYEVSFNAGGLSLASGLYVYRLKVGSKVLTKKMTLIK